MMIQESKYIKLQAICHVLETEGEVRGLRIAKYGIKNDDPWRAKHHHGRQSKTTAQ